MKDIAAVEADFDFVVRDVFSTRSPLDRQEVGRQLDVASKGAKMRYTRSFGVRA